MDAEQVPATWAGPFLLFTPDKLPDPGLLDEYKVFYHTHPISGPVAFIQLFQPGAGEAVTLLGTIF